MSDLARLDQALHRAPGLLDRHRAIDAVLVVEVDHVDAESAQRRVARLDHVLRGAVDADERTVGAALVPELRGEHDVVAAALDGATDQLLVRERTVHVGGVEEVDAGVQGFVDGRERLGVVADAVELTHAHAPETLRGDFESLAERSSFHRDSSM